MTRIITQKKMLKQNLNLIREVHGKDILTLDIAMMVRDTMM